MTSLAEKIQGQCQILLQQQQHVTMPQIFAESAAMLQRILPWR